MKVTVDMDMSKAIKQIEGLKEFLERPKLSREQVQELCEEYFSLEDLRIHVDGDIYAKKMGNKLWHIRVERKVEIEKTIGRDALEEYREKQEMRKANMRLANELRDHKEWTKTRMFWYYVGLMALAVTVAAIASRV